MRDSKKGKEQKQTEDEQVKITTYLPRDPKSIRQMAKAFKKAFSQDKIDEDMLAELMNNTNPERRQKIREEYKNLYNNVIQNDILKADISKKLKDVILALFDTQPEFDARQINNALEKLFGTDEEIINEIFASREKEELNLINSAYKEFYGKSLIEELKNKLKPEYYQLLEQFMLTPRNNQENIGDTKAQQIATEIKEKGIQEYINDTELFKNTFVKKSPQDLVKIAREYNNLYKQSLYEVIKKELNSPLNDLLKKIFAINISPAEYFAKRIDKAISFIGNDVDAILRALTFESEDLKNLTKFFMQRKKADLAKTLKTECKGSYGTVLAGMAEN